MRAEVCQLFLSGTQCPHFSSGCCMTLSKCWLLSAELGVSALCVQAPAGIWDQKVKLSLMVDKCLATISNTVYSITESFLFFWRKPKCDLKCVYGCFLKSTGHKITLEWLKQNQCMFVTVCALGGENAALVPNDLKTWIRGVWPNDYFCLDFS